MYSTCATGLTTAEAVRKTRRQVALAEVLGRERDAHPPAERRRPAPHVHGDVEDLAFDDAHQLALRAPDLQVQAAQRAAGPIASGCPARTAPRMPRPRYFSGVIRLEEEAARVPVDVRLDDDDAGNRGGTNRTSGFLLEDAEQILAVGARSHRLRQPRADRRP